MNVQLVLMSTLAVYVAWNLGANDVANSMGTSVGSKAITIRQALIIAGILEFAGAILFGRHVSTTLATAVINPTGFISDPALFAQGMLAVLITCGVWLNIATGLGLPVASSHAAVGAIAGFGWVAMGRQVVNWALLGVVSLSWVLTPVMSGAIAALLYSQLYRWVLISPYPIQQLYEWIPWLSAGLVSVFGLVVLPAVVQPMAARVPIPTHDVELLLGAIALVVMTLSLWRTLNRLLHAYTGGSMSAATGLTQAISTTSQLHLTAIQPLLIEAVFARFQLLSACFVAFAHGSNDVGNAIAPLAAIAHIQHTGTLPQADLAVPLWVLTLGGAGIVGGLATWGRRVITTIGEGIIALRPSGGFCAELAAATTVLWATSLGLPVSTSHALVGAVVGVGLVQQRQSSRDQLIQFSTLGRIGLAWLVTVPLCAGLSAIVLQLVRSLF